MRKSMKLLPSGMSPQNTRSASGPQRHTATRHFSSTMDDGRHTPRRMCGSSSATVTWVIGIANASAAQAWPASWTASRLAVSVSLTTMR